MKFCNNSHNQVYKIKRNPVSFDGYVNGRLVCEKCFGRQKFFGDIGEIESITSLKNYEHVGSDLDHLFIMTGTSAKKLKNVLLIN